LLSLRLCTLRIGCRRFTGTSLLAILTNPYLVGRVRLGQTVGTTVRYHLIGVVYFELVLLCFSRHGLYSKRLREIGLAWQRRWRPAGHDRPVKRLLLGLRESHTSPLLLALDGNFTNRVVRKWIQGWSRSRNQLRVHLSDHARIDSASKSLNRNNRDAGW
jgi:hypothetical protein